MQYNIKVDVLRITRASDGIGGWDEGETVLHNNLPCRIAWSKGSEKIQFAKDTHYSDAKMYCRVVDITTKDRVSYGGKKYEIVDVNNPDNKNKGLIVTLKLIE